MVLTLNRKSERILPAVVRRIRPVAVLRIPRSLMEYSGNPPKAGCGDASIVMPDLSTTRRMSTRGTITAIKKSGRGPINIAW
jgi:hypothetical protein